MPAATRGYDGGKKVPGRKRHVVTDCLDLLLAVAVTAANVGDRGAAVPLLERVRAAHRSLRLIWADGGYTGMLVDRAREKLPLTLEIVKRSDAPRFVVLPRRWVVERTLSWRLGRELCGGRCCGLPSRPVARSGRVLGGAG
ncbi:transposase [Streptomyces rubiginosohelvolus]|uniref:transposase n=1 Tax=Streptomyces rubiginosohelvolus TaxID=67362 RepID=UPI00343C76F7